MCETPLAEASKSPATVPEKELLLVDLVVREVFFKSPAKAPEKELDDVNHTFAGNPKRKVCCSKATVSLDYNTKVTEPVGLGEGLARCQRCQKKSSWWET